MKQNELRIVEAKTKREAVIAEVRGQVLAQVAEARAQLTAWDPRLEQARRKLEADIVAPANARRQQSEANAKGAAAQTVAQGAKAGADALMALAQAYKSSGGKARDALLLQKLVPIFEQLTSTMKDIQINRLTVIGSPERHANGATSIGAAIITANEQVRAATGVDLVAAARGRIPAT